MEYTCQNPMRFPAAYAVVAEEEMVYIEGGAFTFNVGKYQVTVNIDQQQVLAFCTNIVVNYIRLLGQAAFTNAVNGLQAARPEHQGCRPVFLEESGHLRPGGYGRSRWICRVLSLRAGGQHLFCSGLAVQ